MRLLVVGFLFFSLHDVTSYVLYLLPPYLSLSLTLFSCVPHAFVCTAWVVYVQIGNTH